MEQLGAQLSAAGIQDKTTGESASWFPPVAAPVSGLQPEQTSSQQDQRQDVHDKDQFQRQAQLLSEQLEAANKKLLQAENTANDLRAAMRTKLAVSDQRQIQIESRVLELQQQLQLHSIPAEAERTALKAKCEALQVENAELKQQASHSRLCA